MTEQLGFAGRVARAFIDSKLTQLVILASLLLGVFAVLATPREEEPQIVVPFADVFVEMPGASVKEVEERISIPMEKKVWEIPGVEYVYSISQPGASVVIVRFYVGEDEERSMVKLHDKLSSNFDLIPPGASPPLIKPRSIDDVPILALTLWSERVDPLMLRRIAAQLDDRVKAVPEVSETRLIGGLRRQLRITLDRDRLAGFGVAPGSVLAALGEANRALRVGSFARGNHEYLVDAGAFVATASELGGLVIGVSRGRPVYVRDVASVDDGPEEPREYVLMMGGGRGAPAAGQAMPAVTLSVAKRKGTNAVVIAERVLAQVEAARGVLIPGDVHLTVTRNYGETAREKSNELLKHLLLATLSVTVLIALFLGIRASLVVLIAIPVTLALTLFLYYLYGYTLNRVTLFALIFSIGILVDDAIVVVENIARHFHLPQNRGRARAAVAVEAVDEVGNPTILATFAVIAAILPMAFVGGLMGPYMRPIPVGASVAMLFSLFIAFMVSPWAATRLLRPADAHEEPTDDWTTRLYRRIMAPLIRDWKRRAVFLAAMVLLLLAACSLVFFKLVRVKMLPFDNKSELQVILDMPEGTTLEETARVTRELADRLATDPDVVDLPALRGHGGAVQLQWADPPLLPAASSGAQRGRHPGQPEAEGGASLAEPRHCRPREVGAPRDRCVFGRPDQGGRGATRPAGAPDPGGRGLRRRPRRAARRGPTCAPGLRANAGRRGRGLVRGGSTARLPLCRGQGEGGALRSLHRADRRGAARGPRRGQPRSRPRAHREGGRAQSSSASRVSSGAGWTRSRGSSSRARAAGWSRSPSWRAWRTRPSRPSPTGRTSSASSTSPATWPGRRRARSTRSPG